ncbi:MAG: hypothetical protein U0792_11930 [Gemmataceae bacterium]
MSAPLPAVAVAPNFQLVDPEGGRVLVPDGAGWRPLTEPFARTGEPALLFSLPAHLRSLFFTVLQDPELKGFDGFASKVGRFLAFKELTPPTRAAFELVLHAAEGKLDSRDLWAVVNLGDREVFAELPGLRVRLDVCEGLQLPGELAVSVVPPQADATEPDVLLLIRRPPV